MKKKFLSPSTINLHEDCPKCFYLHIKHEIKRPRGPMPSIATGIDSVLKKHFDYYRRIGELPPVLGNDMEGKLIKFLKPTYFFDISRGYCLLGKLDDCLVCPDGTHSPLDHKTRANPTDYIHPTYQLQMELYSLLIDGNHLKANDRAYLIYYCPDKMEAGDEKRIDFVIDIKEVLIDITHAENAVERAIKCLEKGSVPESSDKCEYCGWVENTGKFFSIDNSKGAEESSENVVSEEDSFEKEEEKPHKETLF